MLVLHCVASAVCVCVCVSLSPAHHNTYTHLHLYPRRPSCCRRDVLGLVNLYLQATINTHTLLNTCHEGCLSRLRLLTHSRHHNAIHKHSSSSSSSSYILQFLLLVTCSFLYHLVGPHVPSIPPLYMEREYYHQYHYSSWLISCLFFKTLTDASLSTTIINVIISRYW